MTRGLALFTSLDGFRAEDPPGPDASSEGGSGSDADVGDGGGGSDGGGGDGGDGGRFCASVDASFCEDFDDPNDTQMKSWLRNVEPGATVARVERGAAEDRLFFRGNGEPMVGIGIIKQSTANTLAVAQAAKDGLEYEEFLGKVVDDKDIRLFAGNLLL